MYYVIIEYNDRGPTHVAGIFTDWERALQVLQEHQDINAEEDQGYYTRMLSVTELDKSCLAVYGSHT